MDKHRVVKFFESLGFVEGKEKFDYAAMTYHLAKVIFESGEYLELTLNGPEGINGDTLTICLDSTKDDYITGGYIL